MRTVQTGYLRSYVLFMVLAAVGLFVLLLYFPGPAPAGLGGLGPPAPGWAEPTRRVTAGPVGTSGLRNLPWNLT
jgi:hypothetical protein